METQTIRTEARKPYMMASSAMGLTFLSVALTQLSAAVRSLFESKPETEWEKKVSANWKEVGRHT